MLCGPLFLVLDFALDETFPGIVNFFDVAPDATPPVVVVSRIGAPFRDAFVSTNLPMDAAALLAAARLLCSTTEMVSDPTSLASSFG